LLPRTLPATRPGPAPQTAGASSCTAADPAGAEPRAAPAASGTAAGAGSMPTAPEPRPDASKTRHRAGPDHHPHLIASLRPQHAAASAQLLPAPLATNRGDQAGPDQQSPAPLCSGTSAPPPATLGCSTRWARMPWSRGPLDAAPQARCTATPGGPRGGPDALKREPPTGGRPLRPAPAPGCGGSRPGRRG
jgi:translation initiation factor IF-2